MNGHKGKTTTLNDYHDSYNPMKRDAETEKYRRNRVKRVATSVTSERLTDEKDGEVIRGSRGKKKVKGKQNGWQNRA